MAHLNQGALNQNVTLICAREGFGWLAFVVAIKLHVSLQITTGICYRVISCVLCISTFPAVIVKHQTIR